ncbi:uncharacterized protein FOMMEDRAFT_160439 [Fomitiporia mediterranea MF3/22]|uniref:uncharacterized protein n=1 Tax=Fomitiporia mediterranea (strain MF3/22) TaxID=694068 RepID=UPI0004408547|nr:uncharacterized protein FOMMEDRAFT_160439 [Fomitiporia mediterranea MF3/22]EJC99408.1 hypothetical protein FOMMEDRAFT_160439 [Fomitiporia mediterranea MF3/22]
MNIDPATQNISSLARKSSPDNVDDESNVLLLYMSGGHNPSSLLHIPHDCMMLYSLKPRKWLLYVATNVCGVDGTLRFLNGDKDFSEEEMEKDVNPGDYYVFCFDREANFLDWRMRATHMDRDSCSSTKHMYVPKELREFYGGCPFSQMLSELCEVCHLVPREKGDDYLRSLLASRGDPDDTMTIDDCRNQIMMETLFHCSFHRVKWAAFLKFLKTNEMPGEENAPPDAYRVTVHCFLGGERTRELLHGAHSDLTKDSGLRDTPSGGGIADTEYRPKDILLDITYAFIVLYCFGSTDAKDMLQKYAEDHYPVDLAKERRIRRLRRDEEQDIEDERHNAFWDWIDAFQMKVHGIRPEDIKAEEERRKKEAEDLDAHRIVRWQKSIDESFCDERDDNAICSGINEGDKLLDTCGGDDEKPVSIEVALSRSPPSYDPYPI